jgi:hypothetical protein
MIKHDRRWAGEFLMDTIINDESKELRWLKEHRHEYMGQWVALDGDRLVAHGTNAREALQAAREAGVKAPFIEQIFPTDDMPYVGW